VQEEDSNFLNDSITISDIINFGSNKIKILFNEGKSLTLNKSFFIDINLSVGMQLSLSEVESLEKRSQLAEAENYLKKTISKYMQPASLLKIKLIKKGFQQQIIDITIEKLTEQGFIDDYEFAKAWISYRMERHPESKKKLYAELQKRRISNHVSKLVISEIFTEETEKNCIKEIIEKKLLKNSELPKEDLAKILLSRGFSPEMFKEFLR